MSSSRRKLTKNGYEWYKWYDSYKWYELCKWNEYMWTYMNDIIEKIYVKQWY